VRAPPLQVGRPWALVAGALLTAVLAACATARPTPPPVESAQGLEQALARAGARLEPAGIRSVDGFAVPARVLRLGSAEVLVFEYGGEAARREDSERLTPDGAQRGPTRLVWREQANLWASGRLIVAYDGTDGGTLLLLTGALGEPLTLPPPPGPEPYPPAVTAALEAWAEAHGIDPAAVAVLAFEAVEWPDACLGLPAPGEVCARSITPGWRVRLQADGEQITARTDALGAQVRFDPLVQP
jgi:hypothetical protein